MLSVTGLVILLVVKVKTYAEEDTYGSNGWRPISREKVVENIQRKFDNTPNAVYSTLHWNPILLAKENIKHVEQTDIKPHDINKQLMSENSDEGIDFNGKQDPASITDKRQSLNLEYLSNSKTKITHEPIHRGSNNNRRHAKNIVENQKNFDVNFIGSHENKNDIVETNVKDDSKVKEQTIDDTTRIYEVTEASEASEINHLLDVDQDCINKERPHYERNLETATEKNLSNILLNILGNYNIRTNDYLTNYAISRNKHNSNAYKGYAYSAPLRMQSMWNSQNHFPLDPVLAVFLSNYGYYLPGFYGFPGNYYNIYGYLASNNIHNNKPFGAYKVYSDTDSSH